ncbi:ABC-2 family transporter protein [Candidatus Collierbacteria bacterium]|nr:ABC-2 family transporter protein [Candidatus Collierbacteria bacterium]
MNNFKRYVKIYWQIIKANTSLILVYRFSLLTNVLTTVSWAMFAIFAVLLYSQQAPNLAGWSRTELLTLTGVFSIVTGFAYTFFLLNFINLPERINTGELDVLLTKPLDSQFLATMFNFSHANIARFLIGISILLITIKNYSMNLEKMIIFLLLLVSAVMILYSIWLLLVTLNFYTRRLDNMISFLLELFDQTSRTPSDAFRIANSWAFNFLLPLFMVVSFPTKALWGKLSGEMTAATVATAIVLFVLSRKFWLYSLRHYSSAGG